MRAKIGMALAVLFAIAVAAGIARPQSAPELINYQGRLADASGLPLSDGTTVDLTFAFYGVESGGTAYLSVLEEDVVVIKGIYDTMIGSGAITPGTESSLADVFANHAEVWVGVKVDSDAEMTPRQRIGSVPFALATNAPTGPDSCECKCDDIDGDGHYKPRSTCTPNDDCHDLDAEIYSGALDYCDKKDNDCDGVTDEDCLMYPDMAMVPSGCFEMGDHFDEGLPHELPVHNVCITSDFYMDVRQVTNSEYGACVSDGGCSAPGNTSSATRGSYFGNPAYGNFPVIYVDWNQAGAYCAWAGKRLPTEAEWEYAARGGLSGKRYPWGDSIAGANANYFGSGDPWDNDTSAVGYYEANGYGLYDMAGNVWEWVKDSYASNYYKDSPINDPPGPPAGSSHVVRGGSWAQPTQYQRVSHRDYQLNFYQGNSTGFRCAQD